ncbi:HEAT repeat domain-containing protein [Terrisporobacter petrolearius]|uniref:HEAT repeat domain-containing protein n=1 Tax=Terrisporobacter petrolearius TaxID=1460447 RepID=UPI001D164D86|nr:HEAT repeat domain-containing protein [Terrisporobacter petrolearius]MCC3864973.1 HEAT repeat domain-containing protein [Terrisporobacter petrolearius]
MDYNEILDFLKENQPFPDDENIKEYEIDMYADAVKYLDEVYSDEKCIPLLLNCFGDWFTYDINKHVEFIICKFDKELVLPHLRQALRSNNKYVRYWACQYTMSFPDKSLIDGLKEIIKNKKENDNDTRLSAVTALTFINNSDVKFYLEKMDLRCEDNEFIEQFMEILDEEGFSHI